MTVVVVQSDDLTAWVGAISGLGGVALGAGIDAWRRRRADRKELRREIEVAAAGLIGANTSAQDAAAELDRHPGDAAWQEILDRRVAAVTGALWIIARAHNEELNKAASRLMASNATGEGHDPGAVPAFGEAMRKARL